MTYRKAITLRYRIFALVAVLAVAVLSWMAISFVFGERVHAEDASEQDEIVTYADNSGHDGIFGTNHAKATKLTAIGEELSSGTYCLENDVVLAKSVEFFQGEDVKLCLHGHSISISGYRPFGVYGDAKLSIYDCSENETGAVISDRGFYAFNRGTFNLYGGTIKGADGYNAVSVSGNAVFNMYGGTIKDNRGTSTDTGGVFIGSGGIFNMYGGIITNNTTTSHYGGAGVYGYGVDSTFHMYGGTISGNVVDCSRADSEEALELFYKGAGVHTTGEFTLEGNSVITDNIKSYENRKIINNLEMYRKTNDDGTPIKDYEGNIIYDGKIKITGKLGSKAKIGVTMPKGAFTKGYTSAGNTVDPSTYFIFDGGFTTGKIGYDSTSKEAAVLDSNDSGTYKMESAKVTGAAAAKVGDTKVTFTIEVTLVNTSDSSKRETITEVYEHTLGSPLHGGNNNISFNYTYKGVTKPLAYVVVAAKFRTDVTWSCSGGTSTGRSSYNREYDGSDIISTISASYKDYNGEKVSAASGDILVQDEDGNTLDSAASPGVYNFFLKASVDYEFGNNLCTVTIVTQNTDDGYDKMTDAKVVEVMGSPVIGDTKVSVRLEVTFKHTKTEKVTTKKLSYIVTLDNPLVAGENTVSFVYKYTDLGNDVQTKALTVKVNTVKKQVTIKWYLNGSYVAANSVKHVYDGADLSNKIVAVYEGVDGTKQNVDGASASMLKKDKNGKTVTSLKEIGEYTLSLAESDNYDFGNNLFTYTVVEKLSDISDLTYEESGQTIFGVSSNIAFEHGTELKVEEATGINSNLVAGEINTAYNVSFVKDSVEVEHAGKLTVNVLIPSSLKGKTYKIFNLKDGVATEMQYTANGNYATFEADDLTCLLFVEVKDAPPNPPIVDNNTTEDPILAQIDSGGLVWLWVILAILAVCGIIIVITLIVKSKRSKK